MDSMRWVTMNPPKMLTAARVTAMKPMISLKPRSAGPAAIKRADDDHRGDRVGHRHQRRVQRRSDPPDHVVADKDRQHEDGQPDHQGRDAGLVLGPRDQLEGFAAEALDLGGQLAGLIGKLLRALGKALRLSWSCALLLLLVRVGTGLLGRFRRRRFRQPPARADSAPLEPPWARPASAQPSSVPLSWQPLSSPPVFWAPPAAPQPPPVRPARRWRLPLAPPGPDGRSRRRG